MSIKHNEELTFDHYWAHARVHSTYDTGMQMGIGEVRALQVADIYPFIAIGGEVGELQNKIKKVLRDGKGQITPMTRIDLIMELGDILWYLGACCEELSVTLSYVAWTNADKLDKRAERGKIQGSGDDR